MNDKNKTITVCVEYVSHECRYRFCHIIEESKLEQFKKDYVTTYKAVKQKLEQTRGEYYTVDELGETVHKELDKLGYKLVQPDVLYVSYHTYPDEPEIDPNLLS